MRWPLPVKVGREVRDDFEYEYERRGVMNLPRLRPGVSVNLEADIVAKHVERFSIASPCTVRIGFLVPPAFPSYLSSSCAAALSLART